MPSAHVHILWSVLLYRRIHNNIISGMILSHTLRVYGLRKYPNESHQSKLSPNPDPNTVMDVGY